MSGWEAQRERMRIAGMKALARYESVKFAKERGYVVIERDPPGKLHICKPTKR